MNRAIVEVVGGAWLALLGCSSAGCGTPACDSPEPVLSDGKDTGTDLCSGGFERRREAVSCEVVFPRADPDPNCVSLLEEHPTEVDCTQDSECGPGYHCEYGGFCLESCGCVPDGCISDDDCAPGFACLCGYREGTCVPADCRSDADCPDDALCVVTTSTYCAEGHVYAVNFGFACQSPQDECLSAEDCGSNEACQGTPGKLRTCEPLEECEGSSCGP